MEWSAVTGQTADRNRGAKVVAEESCQVAWAVRYPLVGRVRRQPYYTLEGACPRDLMKIPGGHTLSILVVEDDIAVAELLRALLNRVSGWGATVVHDAAAAREVFSHVEIEALVLDVNLPGISGVELLELLEKDPRWTCPPVILMSANADQEAITHALEGRPNVRFVPKPFDVDEIVEAIEDAAVGRGQREREAARAAGGAVMGGSRAA